MPRVSPEILVWARETAGLTQEVAAKKLGFHNSARSSAVEKLAAIEGGHKEPSRPQLRKMSGQYRRPLLTFYLSKPPRQSERGVDFRTFPKDRVPYEEKLLDALIRDIWARQSMVRDVMEDEDEAYALPFVDTHEIEDGRDAVLSSLEVQLGIDGALYRSQPNVTAAFNLLRGKTEDSGVFVLLKGDLGNYFSAIETTVFRGFSIADNVAPFIVINDQDARSAWSFTLLHETVHLLLGHTGISGEYGDNEIERFCNDVAGEFLVRESSMRRFAFQKESDLTEISAQIGAAANEFKVSRSMVAYKALRLHLIDQASYIQLTHLFRREWRDDRDRIRAKTRQEDGGPNYYKVRRHRLGRRIVGLVERMMNAGALSTSRAARILGVSPRQVRPLLNAR